MAVGTALAMELRGSSETGRADRIGGGGSAGKQGTGIVASSTHLMRVGAMGHSGFTNCGSERQANRN